MKNVIRAIKSLYPKKSIILENVKIKTKEEFILNLSIIIEKPVYSISSVYQEDFIKIKIMESISPLSSERSLKEVWNKEFMENIFSAIKDAGILFKTVGISSANLEFSPTLDESENQNSISEMIKSELSKLNALELDHKNKMNKNRLLITESLTQISQEANIQRLKRISEANYLDIEMKQMFQRYVLSKEFLNSCSSKENISPKILEKALQMFQIPN